MGTENGLRDKGYYTYLEQWDRNNKDFTGAQKTHGGVKSAAPYLGSVNRTGKEG